MAALLTLLLIFLVLIYVYPLRLMAFAVVEFLGTAPSVRTSESNPAILFIVYGLGFAAMSAAVAGLYWHSLRQRTAPDARKVLLGECIIWSMLSASGGVSAALALLPATLPLAPWTYAALPIVIGIFVARHDWGAQTPSSMPTGDES